MLVTLVQIAMITKTVTPILMSFIALTGMAPLTGIPKTTSQHISDDGDLPIAT